MRRLIQAIVVATCCAVPIGIAAAAHPHPKARAHAVAQKAAPKQEKEANAASDQVLRDAIAQLQQVKNRVHGAAKMYGGHRGKADEHIDAAIRELQAALNFDERRERK